MCVRCTFSSLQLTCLLTSARTRVGPRQASPALSIGVAVRVVVVNVLVVVPPAPPPTAGNAKMLVTLYCTHTAPSHAPYATSLRPETFVVPAAAAAICLSRCTRECRRPALAAVGVALSMSPADVAVYLCTLRLRCGVRARAVRARLQSRSCNDDVTLGMMP